MLLLISSGVKAQFHWFDSIENDQCVQMINSAGYLYLACNIKGSFSLNGTTVNESGKVGFLLSQLAQQTINIEAYRFFYSDTEVELTSIIEGDTNEIIIAGRFFGQIDWDGFSINTGAGQSALFIARLDSAFNVIQLKSIQGNGFKSVGDVIQRQSNIYLSINFTQSLLIDSFELANVNTASGMVIKLNDEFGLVTAHLISGTNNLQGNGIAWSGSTLLLAGTYKGTFVHGADTLPSFTSHSNAFILAFSEQLLPVYSQSFRGVFDDAALGIASQNKTYYVFGNYSGVLQLTPDVSIESTDNFTDVWIAAFDSTAQLLWHRTFNGSLQNQATSISLSEDFIAISGQYIQQIQSGGLSLSSPGDGSILSFTALVNLDGSMAGLTSTTGTGVHFIFSSIFFDSIFCIAGAFNGDWVYSGQQFSGNQFAGFLQCHETGLYTTTNKPDADAVPFSIWPIPASNYLNINSKSSENFQYVLYNLNGMILMKGRCYDTKPVCTIHIADLNAGTYIIRFQNQNFSVSIPFIKM